MPRVHAEHAGHPAGGPAGAGDEADRGIKGQRIGLKATEAGGLEKPEKARFLQRFDGLRRHYPAILGFLRAVAEYRKEFADGLDDLLSNVLSQSGSQRYCFAFLAASPTIPLD